MKRIRLTAETTHGLLRMGTSLPCYYLTIALSPRIFRSRSQTVTRLGKKSMNCRPCKRKRSVSASLFKIKAKMIEAKHCPEIASKARLLGSRRPGAWGKEGYFYPIGI